MPGGEACGELFAILGMLGAHSRKLATADGPQVVSFRLRSAFAAEPDECQKRGESHREDINDP
jgi:hypothetical protein